MWNFTFLLFAWFWLYGIKEAISNINYKFWFYWWEKKNRLYENMKKEIFWDFYAFSNQSFWILFIPRYRKFEKEDFKKKLEIFRDKFYPWKNIFWYELDKDILIVFSDISNNIL